MDSWSGGVAACRARLLARTGRRRVRPRAGNPAAPRSWVGDDPDGVRDRDGEHELVGDRRQPLGAVHQSHAASGRVVCDAVLQSARSTSQRAELPLARRRHRLRDPGQRRSRCAPSSEPRSSGIAARAGGDHVEGVPGGDQRRRMPVAQRGALRGETQPVRLLRRRHRRAEPELTRLRQPCPSLRRARRRPPGRDGGALQLHHARSLP